MTARIRASLCWTSTLCWALAGGCGGSGDWARVTGKVTLNGQPLEGAIVEFRPLARGGSPSTGVTDAKGRYELMHTFEEAGAAPGEYVVSISTRVTEFDDQGKEIEREERVPAEYNRRSELKRVVKPGRNTFDFDL
jgi:hypothetical protein